MAINKVQSISQGLELCTSDSRV